ncbi:O-antigen ligase family protein [Herbiconiux sp. YIM B11900]|uniref:O-antigen ligase family protein n=1 Tax=Herbiconiux sp. YIM B11900 TaxID=3404131 RepID=UPI003F831526
MLASIVFLPEGFTRWLLPKDALFAIAAVAASLALPRGRLPRWVLVAVAAGTLLLAVGIAFAVSPWAAFWGRWPRYEGAVGLSVYLVAVWAGARLLGPGAGRGIRTFWSASAVASVALGVIGVLESVGIDPIPTPWERPGALAGNATDQGILGLIFLALLVLPAVGAAREAWAGRRGAGGGAGAGGVGGGRDRRGGRPIAWALLLGAGAGFGLVTVAVSASRGAFLGAVLVVLALAALQVTSLGLRRPRGAGADAVAHRRRLVRGVLIAVGSLVLLVGVALAVPLTRSRLLGLSPLSMTTVSDRVLIWQESFAILAGRPFTGVGPSGFVDAAPGFQSAEWYASVGTETTLDSPHNVLMQAAMAGGWPLAALLAGVSIAIVVVGCRRWAAAVRATAVPSGPPAAVAAAVGSAPRVSMVGGMPDAVAADRALLLSGALAALLGTAAALMTSFTVPATALLCCLLVGALVARPVIAGETRRESAASVGRVRVGRAVRTGVLAVWAAFLVVCALAELPLQAGASEAEAGRIAAADAGFGVAQALRPWDADIASIAAQQLSSDDVPAAARAEAAVSAERWAREALATVPNSIPTLKALATAERIQHDDDGLRATLDRLAALVPLDPDVRAARAALP